MIQEYQSSFVPVSMVLRMIILLIVLESKNIFKNFHANEFRWTFLVFAGLFYSAMILVIHHCLEIKDLMCIPDHPYVLKVEFHDLAAVRRLQYPRPQTLVGLDWRNPFPTPSACNARFDAALPPARRENKGGLDYQHGLHSQGIGEGTGYLPGITPIVLGDQSENHCVWRGILAKGGKPICRARCVPIEEGIGADIPDVVNCSARTGLDLLSKHYEDAIGFSVVFFLPDSESDFASYTEFLRYLGSKERVGVAKFADDTTLFLVPPSDFLTKAVKVSGPEHLYGVVLTFPQGVPCGTSMNPLTIQPQHAAYSHKTNSMQAGYKAVSQEIVLPVHHSRVRLEDSKLPPKAHGHAVPSTVAASQPSLFLTPELIATLTSLFPANNSSSGSQTVSLSQMSFVLGPPSNVTAGPDIGIAHCKHEHKALDHNNQPVQQRCNQMNSQLQYVPHTQGSIVSSATGHMYQTVPVVPSQSRPVAVAPEINQLSDQCKQHQTAPYGEVQESAETEADKNEQYKATLLFAGNLLSKIQQQPGNLPEGDAGSQ